MLRPALSWPPEAPNSAVPVFPAIGSFGFGMYAWPIVTTRLADSRRRRRFSAVMSSFRIGVGVAVATTVPLTSRASLKRCGRQSVPPFATEAYALRSWSGVTAT